MRPGRILCLLSILLFGPSAIAGPAPAQTGAEGYLAALALYDTGHYEEAATAARALNTADGFALAARSKLVIVRFFDPPAERRAGLERALEDARAALALDENHLEGNLQAAVALGFWARLDRSIREGRAARRHIDRALEHHPGNAWALATLGGWHGAVVMEAGRFLASTLFGAKRTRAIRNFRAAIAADPGNIPIRAGFAKTLLRFNRPRFEAEARPILVDTMALTPHNALETMMLGQSQEILLALEEGRKEDLARLLEAMSE